MDTYRTFTIPVTVRVHDSIPALDALETAKALAREITGLACGDVTIIEVTPPTQAPTVWVSSSAPKDAR